MIQKIDKKAVQDAVQMAYDRCKNETGGKNAEIGRASCRERV